MKNLIVFCALTVFFTGTTIAQDVTLGIKGGVNFADLTNTNNTETRVSFYLGGLAHIHINEHFAVQPEIFYSGQGTRFNNGNAADTRLRLGYINIPLLGQYMTGKGFRLETGPQLGLLASASARTGNVTVSGTDAYKTLDVSWVFGAGYVMDSGLGFSARYNAGLTDITDNSSTPRNAVFSLGLFYHLKRGK